MQSFGTWGVARNRSMNRWIGESCSYNSAAGSFHTKKLCSRLFRQKLKFSKKNSKIAFCAPYGVLRDNVHGHLSLVGKCVVDFLLLLIERFSPVLTVEAL